MTKIGMMIQNSGANYAQFAAYQQQQHAKQTAAAAAPRALNGNMLGRVNSPSATCGGCGRK